MKFNWVDVVFVSVFIRVGYIGFKNGFLPEIFRFLGLLTAFIFSFNSYTKLSQFLSNHIKWTGGGLDVISFLLIFLSILFIFKLLAIGAGLILKIKGISWSSSVMGIVLSFGRGIILVTLIYALFIKSPFEYLSNSARESSFSGRYISRIATPIMEFLERGNE